jgi:hypothetical protein
MPVIRRPKASDVAKIGVTRALTTAMKAAPLWSSAPAVQAAAATWNTVADTLESNARAIADARSTLATLEASQRANRQDWRTATLQITGAVAVACQGSPDLVQSLGFDVYKHVPAVAQGAPTELAALPGKVPGEAVVSWQRGTAKNGFVVQRATDPADPTTVSLPLPWTKTRYTIEGPSRSIVHVRVAAIDATSPVGMGPWSDWVACTVR